MRMPVRPAPMRAAVARATSTAKRMRPSTLPPQPSSRWLDAVLRNWSMK